jgi:hypothetical protein
MLLTAGSGRDVAARDRGVRSAAAPPRTGSQAGIITDTNGSAHIVGSAEVIAESLESKTIPAGFQGLSSC